MHLIRKRLNKLIALLLIPILVSGYILVVANLYHYYQLHRYDGQLLYIKVAAHGTLSVVFVVTAAALVKYFFSRISSDCKNFRITKY